MRLRDLFRPIPIVIMIAMGLLIAACGLIRNTSPADPAAPVVLTQPGPFPGTLVTEETPTLAPTEDLERGPLCNGHPLDVQWEGNLLPLGPVRSLSDKVKNNAFYAGSTDRYVWAIDRHQSIAELCLTLLKREDGVQVAVNDIQGERFATDGSGIAEWNAENKTWSFHNVSNHALLDDRTYCVLEESGKLYVCTLSGIMVRDDNGWSLANLNPPDGVRQFHQMLLSDGKWWMCSVSNGVYTLDAAGKRERFSQLGHEEWSEKGWKLIGSGSYPTNCRDIKKLTFSSHEYIALVGDEVTGALAFVPVHAESPAVDGVNFSQLTSITPLFNGYVVTANAGDGAGGSYYVPSISSANYIQLTSESSYDALYDKESGKLYIGAESGIWEFTPMLP